MAFNLMPMPWLTPPDPQEAFARGFQMYGQVIDDQQRKQQLAQNKQALDMRHAIEAQEVAIRQAEEKRRSEEAAQEALFSAELDNSLKEQLSGYGQEYIPPEVAQKAYLNSFIKASRYLPVKQAAQTFGTMERLQSQEERALAAASDRRSLAEFVQGQINRRQEEGFGNQKEMADIRQRQRKELAEFVQNLKVDKDVAAMPLGATKVINDSTGRPRWEFVKTNKTGGRLFDLSELSWEAKEQIRRNNISMENRRKELVGVTDKKEIAKVQAEIDALMQENKLIKSNAGVPSYDVGDEKVDGVTDPTDPAAAPVVPPPATPPASAPPPPKAGNLLNSLWLEPPKKRPMMGQATSHSKQSRRLMSRQMPRHVPKMTNTPAGLSDNAQMQVAMEKTRQDQLPPLLPPPVEGNPEALSAAIADNVFQQANTQDYRNPDYTDEEVDAVRSERIAAEQEAASMDEVQKLLERGRKAFPGLEVLPAPIKRQASDKLLFAAAEIEAKNNPEMSPEDVLRKVVDELKANAKEYLREIRKALNQ